MNARELFRALVVCLSSVSLTPAQSPDIESFHANGELTWTNANTNLFYCVEWSPSLTAGGWQSNYSAVMDIRSSAPVVTSPVPMFYRICASTNPVMYAAPAAKTGQTNSYLSGDDGDHEKGVAWPDPRFNIQANTNVVLDNLTGLMWTRNANLGGSRTWTNSITYCEALTNGGYEDWRLPSVRELQSLMDYGRDTPALPPGHPFANVQADYWTGTTYADNTASAWGVVAADGGVDYDTKIYTHYVWPVRGGP